MSRTQRESVAFGSHRETADLVEQDTVGSLLRAANTVRNYFQRSLDPYGVTLQQYNVLKILSRADPDGIPTLSIGEWMHADSPGVSRIVDRLERRGWVERARGEEDRRQILCALTPKGSRLLTKLEEVMDEAEARIREALDPADEDTLLSLLGRLGVAVGDD